jgi:hypothetical protein
MRFASWTSADGGAAVLPCFPNSARIDLTVDVCKLCIPTLSRARQLKLTLPLGVVAKPAEDRSLTVGCIRLAYEVKSAWLSLRQRQGPFRA